VVDKHRRLEQVLADDPTRSWSQSLRLLPCFALSGPEQRFARQLLQRKRNIWLFRCNQRRFCGDFIIVDMSAARLKHRSVAILELKSHEKLTLDGGAGIQFRNATAAVEELANVDRVVSHKARFMRVCGGISSVFQWIVSPNALR
jgi:hypothetical protein